MAGRLSYFLAAALSGASGMLLAPLVTAHYEMGFVVGLKGFVGAAMGGLVNYPLSVAGVFIVGVLESFASFLSSSYRDALVFAMVIPILLWRNSRAGADLTNIEHAQALPPMKPENCYFPARPSRSPR